MHNPVGMATQRLLHREADQKRDQKARQADDEERGAPAVIVNDPTAKDKADHRTGINTDGIKRHRH